MTHRDPDLRDPERYTRAQVLQFIADQVAAGLPAPESINFGESRVNINLDSIADRLAWQVPFGMADCEVSEQPVPGDEPASWTSWLTNVWHFRHGLHVALTASDPITDDNRRLWVESGRAARRAEYLARDVAEGGEQS